MPARPCRRAAALDTFSQQFLADSADYLMSIAVAQRKVHHNQPKRSQTAQGAFFFQKQRLRACARGGKSRGHTRDSAACHGHIHRRGYMHLTTRLQKNRHAQPPSSAENRREENQPSAPEKRIRYAR